MISIKCLSESVHSLTPRLILIFYILLINILFAGCALVGKKPFHETNVFVDNNGIQINKYMNAKGQIDSLDGVNVVKEQTEADIWMVLTPIKAVESPLEVRVEETDVRTGKALGAGMCATPTEGFEWLACARTGWYLLKSRPPGARLIVDGKAAGITPMAIKLEPGATHEIEMSFGRKDRKTASIFAGDAGTFSMKFPNQAYKHPSDNEYKTLVDRLDEKSGPFIIVGVALGLAAVGFLLPFMFN